ncbi:TolC family protein [Hydrogenovibrio kuenenii]|uniref:TolC family protein n=1 Tax=Hydrogenovibrio kuenenii TaxID=63658 RepID=UPI0004643539|nr:TolC family protein [Hydrogenovibrio kuenenii]
MKKQLILTSVCATALISSLAHAAPNMQSSTTGNSVVSSSINSTSSPNVQQLVDHLLATLPEREKSQALTDLTQSTSNAGHSWIAGDVDLVVKHENDSMTGNQGYQSWEVGAAFPLWLPGQSDAKLQLSSNYHSLQNAQASRLKLMASNKLRSLIWQLKKADATLTYRKKNHDQAVALERLVKQRVEAGENPRMDLLMAQQASLNAMKLQTIAQQNYQIALNSYATWTGSKQLPAQFSETKQSLPLEEHPDIAFLQSLQSIESEKLKLTKFSQKQNPNLYLGTKTDKSHQTSNNTMLVAQISFPLGINKQSAVAVSEQNQNMINADIALAKAKQQISINRQNAETRLVQAQQTEKLAKTQLTLSTESVALAKQAYQQGETSIQILLQATQQLYDNQLNFKISQLNTQQSISDYNQTQGVSLK